MTTQPQGVPLMWKLDKKSSSHLPNPWKSRHLPLYILIHENFAGSIVHIQRLFVNPHANSSGGRNGFSPITLKTTNQKFASMLLFRISLLVIQKSWADAFRWVRLTIILKKRLEQWKRFLNNCANPKQFTCKIIDTDTSLVDTSLSPVNAGLLNLLNNSMWSVHQDDEFLYHKNTIHTVACSQFKAQPNESGVLCFSSNHDSL